MFYHQCFYSCLWFYFVCCCFILFLDRLCSNVDMKIMFVSLLTTNKIRNCIMDRFGLAVDYQRPFLTKCSSAENNLKLSVAFNKTRDTHVTCLHTVIRGSFIFDWPSPSSEQACQALIRKGLVFRGSCLFTFLCRLFFLLIVYHCYYFALIWRNQRVKKWDLVSAQQWQPFGKRRQRY